MIENEICLSNFPTCNSLRTLLSQVEMKFVGIFFVETNKNPMRNVKQ
jgi:hypothetical protein